MNEEGVGEEGKQKEKEKGWEADEHQDEQCLTRGAGLGLRVQEY